MKMYTATLYGRLLEEILLLVWSILIYMNNVIFRISGVKMVINLLVNLFDD